MADDLELALKIKADVKKALADLDKLTREIKQQGTASEKAAAGNRKNSRSLADLAKNAKRSEKAIGNQVALFRQAAGALGLYAAVAKTIQAIRIADEFKQIEARVRRVTEAQGDYNEVWSQLTDISNDNGQAIGSTVRLFEGINRAAPEIDATRDEVLAVTRAVQQLGILSGASGEQMRNAMLQFSQAMAGGVVRAEEMNSIIDNTPGIAEAIAKGMGLTVGQLRKAVNAGTVLSRDVFASLQKQAPQIAEAFKDAPASIERAGQSFANGMTRIVSEIDKAIGVTNFIAGMLDAMAETANAVADAIADSESNAEQLRQAEIELAEAMNKSLRIIERIDHLREKQARQGSLAKVEQQQIENLEYLLSHVDQRADAIAARIAAMRKAATNETGEAGGKPEGDNKGIPNSLATAIAEQTKANDHIKGLVDQRQSLLDELDALTKRLSGPADPAGAIASANVFTLNRLRGSAQTKFEAGDFSGGLEDLERAKTIVEKLAESGEISKGYLQTQIQLVRKLADDLKDNEAAVEVPIKPVIEHDAHVVTEAFAKLRAEFERQQIELKTGVDEQAGARVLESHLANLQRIAGSKPIVVDMVIRQSTGLGEAFSINLNGREITARSTSPIDDFVAALEAEQLKAGGD